MSLTLTKRACMLGPSINVRTQHEGDDDIPACDIPLVGIMLDPAELGRLAGDPFVHNALFNKKVEPMLPQFEALVLREKLEGATVGITVGNLSGEGKLIGLEDCRLKSLTLQPMSGGATALALKVHYAGTSVPYAVGLLTAHLNSHVTVDIAGAAAEVRKPEQQDLAIHTFGDSGRNGEAAPTAARG